MLVFKAAHLSEEELQEFARHSTLLKALVVSGSLAEAYPGCSLEASESPKGSSKTSGRRLIGHMKLV